MKIHSLIDNPEQKEQVTRFRAWMTETMDACKDPMRTIYQNRNDKAAVGAYLATLDAASKARKAKPEIYRRGHARAGTKPEATPNKPAKIALDEFLRRAGQRAEKRGKPFDLEKSTKRYHDQHSRPAK